MHELSIAMSIVEIAEEAARNAGAAQIERIDLELGTMSGLEWTALDFAWSEAVIGTALENAVRHFHRMPGKARCSACNTVYPTQTLYESCPECGENLVEILGGQELRVKSIEIA